MARVSDCCRGTISRQTLSRTPIRMSSGVTKKSARTYTESAHDILEADLRHLQHAADMYDALARDRHWKTIECYDAGKEKMRTPEEISAEVLAAALPCLATMKENR